MKNLLWTEAREVASGKRLPRGTSAEYGLAEVAWAERVAKPNETVEDAHARLIAKASPVLWSIRLAGGLARAFEGDCNPSQLLEALGFEPDDGTFRHEARVSIWAGLFDLAKLARLEHETVGDALRRLVDENAACHAALYYVMTEREVEG